MNLSLNGCGMEAESTVKLLWIGFAPDLPLPPGRLVAHGRTLVQERAIGDSPGSFLIFDNTL